MVRDPDSIETCASCHSEITTTDAISLHSTLDGYLTVMNQRAGTEELCRPGLELAFENHCADCHTSCGQCHVSRPTSAGGGLLDGHSFKNPPPMNLTCTGCHGSRVNDEYKGKNEAPEGGMVPADVHFNPGGMACFECHGDAEMHGDVPAQEPPLRRCRRRNARTAISTWKVGPTVIRSTPCTRRTWPARCAIRWTTRTATAAMCRRRRRARPTSRSIRRRWRSTLARTPSSRVASWDYVLLRHVPIDRDSFSFYGENLLPEYDSLPTFAYATPHNIQRNTPQNASCDACHGNESLFLTADKVPPDELEANKDVIVDVLPGP